MKYSIDVATRVSRELSTVMESVVNDPDLEDAPTLADVDRAVQRLGGAERRRDELLHPQHDPSLQDEIRALIEAYGEEAPAFDFLPTKASEPLSRVIEYAMDDPVVRHEPTLGYVRDAMAAGLIAELVGDGVLEPDQDQTLMAEIDGIIERHGSDALAEEFIRFE